MRKNVDISLWTKDSIDEQIYANVKEDMDCDVLIIGGGITGALTGYYCAKNNINTILLEENLIAHESTLSSTSIIHYEIDTDLIRLRSKIGENEATEVFKLCLNSVYELEKIIEELDDDCEFIRRPSFYYSNKEENYKYFFNEFNIRKEKGFDVEFLDGKKEKDKYSFDFSSGIFSYNSGAEVNPVKLSRALLRYNSNNGVRIFEKSKVEEINLEEDPFVIVNNKKIRAKKIIMAMGYNNLDFFDDKFWIMSRSFTIATKPVENYHGWFQRSIIRDDNNPYIYLRTTADNRIVIGGEDIVITENDKEILEMDDNQELAKYKYKVLENKLNKMFPQIADKEVEFKFNGIFVDSYDGLPYIGQQEDFENVYFNTCIGSNGVLYGLLGGKLIIDDYLNGSKEINLFSFERNNLNK